MTLSTPVKLVALAAVATALGILGFTFLYSQRPPAVIPVASPVHAPRPVPHHAPPKPASTLPAPLQEALAHHGVVVAVLYAAHVPGDDDALQAARQGAQDAHAGFAILNVRNQAVAQAIALKLPGSSDPSVLIVRRPAKIVTLLAGSTDRAVVAQAARDAHA